MDCDVTMATSALQHEDILSSLVDYLHYDERALIRTDSQEIIPLSFPWLIPLHYPSLWPLKIPNETHHLQ